MSACTYDSSQIQTLSIVVPIQFLKLKIKHVLIPLLKIYVRNSNTTNRKCQHKFIVIYYEL